MASSIFTKEEAAQRHDLDLLISTLRTKNPNVLFNSMMRENPQFAEFVRANKGKSPRQIAEAYNLDLGLLNKIL